MRTERRVICAACRADVGRMERVGRRDTCPGCGADLHACRQCALHDPRLANACREPEVERVPDKIRGNFCEHYRPHSDPGATPRVPAGDARDALARLFRAR